MITKVEGVCQFTGCDKPAAFIAAIVPQYIGGERGYSDAVVGCYCEEHAKVIEDTGTPEYLIKCPNCGCRHGVN